MKQSRATNKLRRLARDNRWTLDQLAVHLDVSRAQLVGWLSRGKFPRPETVRALDDRGIVAAADWYAAPCASEAAVERAA